MTEPNCFQAPLFLLLGIRDSDEQTLIDTSQDCPAN